MWVVYIFSTILRGCFACISVQLDLKSLKITDIHFHAVQCLNLTFFCVVNCPFCIPKSNIYGLKLIKNVPDSDVVYGILQIQQPR